MTARQAKPERDLPVKAFASLQAWETWLKAQPATSGGVWLKLAKKSAKAASVSRQEAIDGALCHGWIDGQLDKFDADWWLVRFTPRKSGSKWSEKNRDRALVLMKEGRLTAAGLHEIERAKADGRWDAAYAPQSTAAIPDDLDAALAKNQKARVFFATLDGANRYAILHRVNTAKKAETRARRVETFVAMLSRGETIHPRKGAAKQK
jgi:uncharacterized protein YdeI (YjbR/CyaY-like superfamily)